MRTLAISGSRELSVKAIADKWEIDPYAIETWIRNRFRFRAENIEMIRDPKFMAAWLQRYNFLEGDCDDIATFIASGLKALGYGRVFFVAIRTDPNDMEYKHVFVSFNGSRIDPTVSTNTVVEFVGVPIYYPV